MAGSWIHPIRWDASDRSVDLLGSSRIAAGLAVRRSFGVIHTRRAMRQTR